MTKIWYMIIHISISCKWTNFKNYQKLKGSLESMWTSKQNLWSTSLKGWPRNISMKEMNSSVKHRILFKPKEKLKRGSPFLKKCWKYQRTSDKISPNFKGWQTRISKKWSRNMRNFSKPTNLRVNLRRAKRSSTRFIHIPLKKVYRDLNKEDNLKQSRRVDSSTIGRLLCLFK